MGLGVRWVGGWVFDCGEAEDPRPFYSLWGSFLEYLGHVMGNPHVTHGRPIGDPWATHEQATGYPWPPHGPAPTDNARPLMEDLRTTHVRSTENLWATHAQP